MSFINDLAVSYSLSRFVSISGKLSENYVYRAICIELTDLVIFNIEVMHSSLQWKFMCKPNNYPTENISLPKAKLFVRNEPLYSRGVQVAVWNT